MKKVNLSILTIASTIFLLQACKKDVTKEHNDSELITTVKVKLTPTSGGTALEYKWTDPDGAGGKAPVIQDIVLAPNKTYNAEIFFLDESKTPAVDITGEVVKEKDAHRVYYTTGAGSTITVTNLNKDGNGVDLGTTSLWTVAGNGNSTMNISLRHYAGTPPNKAQADAINSTKASTDVEVVFPTKVQ